MKSKTKVIILSFLLAVSIAQTAQGALVICGRNVQLESEPGIKKDPASQDCTPDQLVNEVVSIINYLIDSAAVLAIAYVLYGGVNMILARGNSAKFDSARATMSNAVQGLLIVLTAYLIVGFAITFVTGGKKFDEIFNFLPHQ